ncbi:MAG: hypothetical protein EBZ77_02685 [Chitinophagia bacterium]|nr:hypothetical protein [Chitinophagia bacterium]
MSNNVRKKRLIAGLARPLIASLLLLLSFGAIAASADTGVWKRANDYYQQKNYDSAAVLYEQLAAGKTATSLVFYNLGNTYYRLNKIGPCILNYERALQADPENEQARDNLLLARKRMTTQLRYVEEIFFIRWWESLTAPTNATLMATLAFLCFVAAISGFLVRLLSIGSFKLPRQVPYLLAFIWVVLLIPAIAAANRSVNSGRAVIMMNDAPLNITAVKGKPLGLLPEGTTVKVKSTQGEMTEVVIPDGRTGWVQTSLLTRI